MHILFQYTYIYSHTRYFLRIYVGSFIFHTISVLILVFCTSFNTISIKYENLPDCDYERIPIRINVFNTHKHIASF